MEGSISSQFPDDRIDSAIDAFSKAEAEPQSVVEIDLIEMSKEKEQRMNG